MGKHTPLPTDPAERETELRRRRTDRKAVRKGGNTRRAREYIAEYRNRDLVGG